MQVTNQMATYEISTFLHNKFDFKIQNKLTYIFSEGLETPQGPGSLVCYRMLLHLDRSKDQDLALQIHLDSAMDDDF